MSKVDMVLWRDRNAARASNLNRQEMMRKCSRVGMAKAPNTRVDMGDVYDRSTPTSSSLVRGAVFRISNAQLENGGSKNVFDWKMSVFRAYERWG
jgi:hypothetical protein